MINRLVILGLLVSSLMLSYTHSAFAQAEGLAIEHSPNGKRALSHHAEKRAALEATYVQSIGDPGKRFEQACERQIKRYTNLLTREMRALTRAGSIEQAKAVQAALAQAETWTVTSPDAKGLHFLSQANLEVKGSEKATKLGVDMLVGVESAGVTYAKQIAHAFDQYKAKVGAARQALRDELTKIQEQEQRSGRLDAVDELNQALKALENPPPIDRPEPAATNAADEEKPTKTRSKEPPPYVGYYLIEYEMGFLSNEKILIQLTGKGGIAHSRFKYSGSSSRDDSKHPITIVSQKKNLLVLTHQDTMRKADMVYEIKLSDGLPLSVMAWPDEDAKRNSRGYSKGTIRRLGSPGADLLGLKDGTYVMAMDRYTTYEPRRRRGTYSIRLKISDGIIYKTHYNYTLKPERWKSLGMEFYTVETSGRTLILKSDTGSAYGERVQIQIPRQGEIKVERWRNATAYEDSLPPDTIGKLVRVKK